MQKISFFSIGKIKKYRKCPALIRQQAGVPTAACGLNIQHVTRIQWEITRSSNNVAL